MAKAYGEQSLMSRKPELNWIISNDFGQRLLLTIGVYLIILGVRLTIINSFGSDIPYWDQWDAEAMNLYIPYFDGTLTWHHWFQPHNEHRIVLTRLAMLVLLLANGQWDAQLQMVMNAIVYSAVGTALFWVLMPGKTARIFWGGAVVAIFSLPFGWENTLGGFQLSFYLMIGLSMATLWILPHARFGTKRWCLGGFCALLSLFTMASGFLTCVVVLAILLVEIARDHWASRRFDRMPTVVLCLFLIISGILLRGNVPGHYMLQAHSIGTFVLALAANLSWPIQDVTFWALLQWLPFVLYLGTYLGMDECSNKMTFVIGLGLLVILQAAATAYSRGGGGSIAPVSRYQDILSLGVLVNLYAMSPILAKHGGHIRPYVELSLCIIWIAVNCNALFEHTSLDVAWHLPGKHAAQQAALKKVSGYIKAKRIDLLAGASNADLPYPDAKRLALILGNPGILKILPPTLMPENREGRLRNLSQGFLTARYFLLFSGLSCILLGMIHLVKHNGKQENCVDRVLAE